MSGFTPEQLADIRSRAKKQIRQRMRTLRSAHPASVLAARSAKIVERIRRMPAFAGAQSIALFWPMLERGEVDLRLLDALARADGKSVHYPFMEAHGETIRTGLRPTATAADLVDRGQRFAEPDPARPAAQRGEVDLVVVPALAVAVNGHRIGYGRGFYDATLPDYCPPARSIVVAFDFQLLGEVPTYESDIACDTVVTDERTIDVRALAAG